MSSIQSKWTWLEASTIPSFSGSVEPTAIADPLGSDGAVAGNCTVRECHLEDTVDTDSTRSDRFGVQ